MSIHALGPRGFDTYTYQELITSPFTWIEDEAMWEFLYRKVHQLGADRSKRLVCDAYSIATWEQFRRESGSMRPEWKLRHHYLVNLAPNLHKASLPGEAKVKLYFGLGMPVNFEYLKELRTEAVVEVDLYYRMVKFSYGTHRKMNFVFPGNLRPNIVVPESLKMLMFLCARIHDPSTGDVRKPYMIPTDSVLWKEFKDRFRSATSVRTLARVFREEIAPRLKKTELDYVTKAKLCFALKIPVHPELLKQFDGIAKIELDDAKRIINFLDRNGFEMKLDANYPHAWSRNVFTEEEEGQMFAFVYKKIQNAETHRIRRQRPVIFSEVLWEEFNESNSVNRDSTVYIRHFSQVMLPIIHLAKMPSLMKMALHFSLEHPPHEDFLKRLRKDGIVELDKNGCIIAFKPRTLKRTVSSTDNSEMENGGSEAEIQKTIFEIDENQNSTLPGTSETMSRNACSFSPMAGQPPERETTSDIESKEMDVLDLADVREILNKIIDQIENA